MSTHEHANCNIRLTVYFTGRVQGVNFRYTTQITASQFDVTGYVRNLSDGRVELVAEGESDEVERFRNAVMEAMAGYITHTETSQSTPTGEFTSFRIAR